MTHNKRNTSAYS